MPEQIKLIEIKATPFPEPAPPPEDIFLVTGFYKLGNRWKILRETALDECKTYEEACKLAQRYSKTWSHLTILHVRLGKVTPKAVMGDIDRPPIDELEVFLDEKGSTDTRILDSRVMQLLIYIRQLEERIYNLEANQ